jgi:hypothetical protein
MAPDELRAPDVSVGNVPNEPGWVEGAPPLALEYADRGTNEGDLQDKVRSLLDAGTRWVWVVRLTGARIVQVFEREKLVRVAKEGELLEAPGVLANPVPVAALFDREAALDASVRNLLLRKGIPALDEALARSREEGHEAGHLVGLRAAIEDLCELLSIELTVERREWLATQNAAALDALRAALKRDRRWP